MRDTLNPASIPYRGLVALMTLWGFYGLMGVVDRALLYFLLVPVVLAVAGMWLARLPGRADKALIGFAFVPLLLASAILLLA